MDMIGKQLLTASKDELLDNTIIAAARLPQDYHKSDNMGTKVEQNKIPKSEFSNRKSTLISCIGGIVIALIIFKLIANYSGII